MTDAKEFIKHLSERPWSAYTSADYSIEQWHRSCLIHQHDGAPTSKSQCKLPVKTPNGALNRNGIHAAAAALAGARGGVNASSEEKHLAAQGLIRFYNQMDEKPPPSLLTHADLEHYGTKGMRWGVRNSRSEGSGVSKLRAKVKNTLNDPVFRSNAKRRVIESRADIKKRTSYRKSAKALSDDQLKKRIARMELEKKYNDLNKVEIRSARKQITDGALTKGLNRSMTDITSRSTTFAVGQALTALGHPGLAKAVAPPPKKND